MANINIVKGEIGNALTSVAPNHILGVANDIFDEIQQKYQQDINAELLGRSDGALDVSAKYPTSGVEGGNTYTLEGALAVLNANLSASKKKGGMSIKFIQTTPAKYTVVKTEGATEQPTGTELQSDPGIISGTYTAGELSVFSTLPSTLNSSLTYYLTVTETVDEQEVTTYTTWVITKATNDVQKYVQYRYMETVTTAATFTNVANWQGVDEEPTSGSDNLVKSGGVAESEKILGQDILGSNEELTGFSLLQYTVNIDGKFGTNTSAIYKHAAIPVQEGDIYYLIGTSRTCRAAFATSNEYSQGGDIPLVPNTEVMLMSDIGKYYKFIIPTGCTYLLFNAGSNYGTRVFKHFDHDLKLLVGASNGILKVDSFNKQFVFTDNTQVVCEGKLYTLSGSLSYNSLLSDGIYCLIVEQGNLSIIPYSEVVGKNVFAIFKYSFFRGDNYEAKIVQNIIYSAIPTNLGRQEYMLNGFSIAPINFDNVNKKIVWNERLYFRVGGVSYTVEPGELNYSTYDGKGTTLSLIVELTDTPNYYAIRTANLIIGFNGYEESEITTPSAIGNYVIAWFHRSASNWSNGVVDNSISIMPITIDGKEKFVSFDTLTNTYQNYLVSGATFTPIDIDNTNSKFKWTSNVYFRINGKQYTVQPGELAFSSYTGGNALLALILELSTTPVAIGSNSFLANFVIAANSMEYTPNMMGHFVLAWFYRSGSSWASGHVVSVYSNLPFTIDGKDKIETKLEPIKSELEFLQSDIKYCNFPVLPLVNKGITASGLGSENTKRASQETLFAVPYNGCTIKVNFSIPNMVMGIRSGANADNLSTNHYWMADGDSYTIPVEHNYYRVSFALTADLTNYYDIVASEVEELISNGSASVKYISKDKGIIERTYDSDAFVKAVILNLDNTLQGNGMLEFPLFTHITDAHGDITRIENAVDYSKYLGVDAMFATGDIIANNINDNFEGLSNKLAKYDDMPTLYCRGNHETYGNSDVNFDVYGKYYQAIATKYNYNITEGKTYYYKDFVSKKIRVIAVDPYEKNIVTNNTCAYSQDQINWFIATIKSTPQDYGILVIVHSPESVPYNTPSIQPITQKDKFFLDGTPLYWSTPKGVSIPPLMKIIDAFISRSSLQTTFTETTQTGSATININADFTSGVNTGVEFIAWICGHEHLDLIGEYNRSSYGLNHRQLVLNTTCATALYGSDSYPYLNNMSDLPRGGIGVVQDAITIYAIDRKNHEVRIARCGSRFSNKFVERNCMTVRYID